MLCCLAFFATAGATDNAVKIQEAAYLFEMKGEYAEAQSILEDISKNGSKEERATADFLLGKINDLSGNNAMASFYYQQNLKEIETASQAYWVSERLAELSQTPTRLIEKKTRLRAQMQNVFSFDSTRILLNNRLLYVPSSGKYTKLPDEISDIARIMGVLSNGIWWTEENKLYFTPIKKIFPAIDFTLQKNLGSFEILSSFSVGYIDGDEFVLISGNDEKFRTEPRYRDCGILKLPSANTPIALNCPDNALHLLSKEDGHEIETISMLDPISKVFHDANGFLVCSGDDIWHYSYGNLKKAQWRKHGVNVEDAVNFGNYFAILESSGNISLINTNSGEAIVQKKTSAASLMNLNTGVLGLLSLDGAIIATDTLLRPIWQFHLGNAPIFKPWVNEGVLYYPSTADSLKHLNILHYGKKPILSQYLSGKASFLANSHNWEAALPLIDSSLSMEPGNADALFLKAMYLEETEAPQARINSAWANVIKLTNGVSGQNPKILEHFAKTINAEKVKFLPLSPNTRYPSFISYKKSLLTLDPASRQIIAFDNESGDVQWRLDVGKLESAPVLANKDNQLAFASGFSLNIINIDKPSKPKQLELPGKVFQLVFTSDALYASTWNGFLLKVILQDQKIAWTRKINSTPFFSVMQNNQIVATTLDGSIQHIWEVSGQKKVTGPKLQASISQVLQEDSTIVYLSTDQRIFIYNGPNTPLSTISTDKDILSANLVNYKGKKGIVVSLSSQEIRLFALPGGEATWTFQGKNSTFGQMVPYKESIWIDQGEELIEISLENGKVSRKFRIPGGAGSPFTIGQTLYSVSPQHLLYLFNLQEK